MDTSLHCMFAVPSVLSHFLLNVELELPIIPVCGVNPALDLINRNRLQEELRYIVDSFWPHVRGPLGAKGNNRE